MNGPFLQVKVKVKASNTGSNSARRGCSSGIHTPELYNRSCSANWRRHLVLLLKWYML